MTRYVMVADLRRCVGCQTCTAACKEANATPPDVQWRRVLDIEVGEYPNVNRIFVPTGCQHCADPPCMHVCPTTATGQRPDGIVFPKCVGQANLDLLAVQIETWRPFLPYLFWNSMNQGISILHGPHQVAQKSSRITLPLNDDKLTPRFDVSLSVKFRFAGFAFAGHDAVAGAAAAPSRGNGRSTFNVSSASASELTAAIPHFTPFVIARLSNPRT